MFYFGCEDIKRKDGRRRERVAENVLPMPAGRFEGKLMNDECKDLGGTVSTRGGRMSKGSRRLPKFRIIFCFPRRCSNEAADVLIAPSVTLKPGQ
jgi:hypothetical protein